ncbi:hypothetical protein B0J12DRAFT_700229 [Macrophomina phaseolina]|uniref:Rhodopsin domain-containing protein n=1 Tax=Macrophomina phaseolina TaxID=35725 RepID=A0ABQ8G8N9_9PEZI|nr:hypothetical protein B0J12DRAFT_700229 [Macrophomina phaseolina]
MQVMLQYGLGKHVWNISLADFSPYWLLGRVLAAVFYTTAMFFVKLSLLLLYRRVFDVEHFFKRWWFVMLYSVVHTLVAILLSFMACRPPAAQWDLHIRHRKCISPKSLLAIPVFHCINDLLILSLPIPLVWKLNLNRRRKIQVTFVFALGSASCIVSILRIWPIHTLVSQPRYGDVTWHWTPVAIWTQVELTFAITCASVPVLKPFLSRHFPSFFSSDERTNNNRSPAGEPVNRHHYRHYNARAGANSPGGARLPLGRNASTKTIGQVSTRVMGGVPRRWVDGWGLSAIGSGGGRAGGREDVDVELGLRGVGGGGGRAGDVEDDGRGGGEGRPGGVERDCGRVLLSASSTTMAAGGTGSSAGRMGLESSGGKSGKGGGGRGFGDVELVGGKRARVSDDAGSEECIVKDIKVGGDEEAVASPASEARSSTVFTAEGVCEECAVPGYETMTRMDAHVGKTAMVMGGDDVR